MGLTRRLAVLAFLCSACFGLTATQSAAAPEDESAAGRGGARRPATLPRTVRFSGALVGTEQPSRPGVVAVTFTMYSEPQGGSPIWVETQNVTLDENGRYTALLGSASGDGLPVTLFASGEARWLGVRIAEEGAAEQQRVQLVSVPYALASADAQTLGGRPVSDFQLSQAAAKGTDQAPGPTPSATVINGSAPGVLNYMTKWENATSVIPSYLLYENGSNIGIGTITPTALLHVNATVGDAFNLYTSTTAGGSVAVYANHFGAASIGYAGFFTKTGAGTTNIGLYAEASGATNNYAALFQGGNVGIGTSSPVAKLQVNATNQDAINIYSTATGGGSVALFASHTGAAPLGYAGYFSKTGAGTTNIGLVGSASGAANNYAALFPDGNVGIGTSSPTQKLHVAGMIYSSTGGFRFPDNTVQTTAATGGGAGDITGVTAGNGLAGGATSGDATLSIRTCTEGQMLKYIGGIWTCFTDNGGGSPSTQTFTISGPSFNNLGSKVVASRMTLDNNASGTNQGWFILPFDGGTITALRVCGRDNDAQGQIVARLYRRSITLGVFSNADLMASIGSGAAFGSDTTQCFTTTTITNGALDTLNYAYTVELEMSAFVQVNAVQVDSLDNN